jgi:hypothetical protein
MGSAEQLLSLPDAGVLPTLQGNWRTHNARVAMRGGGDRHVDGAAAGGHMLHAAHHDARQGHDRRYQKAIVDPKAASKPAEQAAAPVCAPRCR